MYSVYNNISNHLRSRFYRGMWKPVTTSNNVSNRGRNLWDCIVQKEGFVFGIVKGALEWLKSFSRKTVMRRSETINTYLILWVDLNINCSMCVRKSFWCHYDWILENSQKIMENLVFNQNWVCLPITYISTVRKNNII